MTKEARLTPTEVGLRADAPGWFVVNVARAAWFESPHFGSACVFEGDARFDQLGINVHVLQPGQPACLYHRESSQEAFLVLEGECTLVVDDEERSLSRWDFFHCPPGTNHVFVGAGDGPCAILMTGARTAGQELCYPVSETARKHGASVERETPDPREAYAELRERQPVPAPWPRP